MHVQRLDRHLCVFETPEAGAVAYRPHPGTAWHSRRNRRIFRQRSRQPVREGQACSNRTDQPAACASASHSDKLPVRGGRLAGQPPLNCWATEQRKEAPLSQRQNRSRKNSSSLPSVNSTPTAHFIKALGDEVRTRRQTKKRTKWASRRGPTFHPNTISLVERAQIIPKIDALLALAAALDTCLSQLVKAAEARADLRQIPSASQIQQP